MPHLQSYPAKGIQPNFFLVFFFSPNLGLAQRPFPVFSCHGLDKLPYSLINCSLTRLLDFNLILILILYTAFH